MQGKLTPSVAAIIVTIIISATLLFCFGAFDHEKNYATITFDGGYQKLGLIRSQRIFTHAAITNNGNVTQGTFDEITEKLNQEITPAKKQLTFNPGVRIQARTGIEFEGSESDFKLTTDQIDLTSTAENPITVADILKNMKDMREKTKIAMPETVKASVELSATPKDNSSFVKLLARLAK
jgi:hypothetical protein